MNNKPKQQESDNQKTDEVEIEMVPEGTFAGTIDKPILVEEGEPVLEDTGDQGGGQN